MLQLLIASVLVSPASDHGERPGQDGAPVKDLVTREGPEAWGRYYARAKGLQGSYSIAGRDLSAKKGLYKSRCEIKQREGCALLLAQTETTGYLDAVNPQYAFAMQRSGEDGQWAVTGVGSKTGRYSIGLQDPRTITRMVNRFPFTFAAAFSGYDLTVVDPGFSIKKAAPVVVDSRRLIRVDFDYTSAKDPVTRSLRAGSVLFDPDRYWTIRQFEIQVQTETGRMTSTASFDYHEAGGFPVLKEIVSRRKNPGRSIDLESTWKFDLRERNVPEREFRLSAFGFPEPHGVVWRGNSRWYLWFIAAAVASLGLGWYFRHLIRRRKEALAKSWSTTPVQD
jgi:hypothetical protein